MTDTPENGEPAQPETPTRRELIKKLAEAAALPALVATFVASDATDAAAY
jgi:hypothetical protein